MADNEQLVADAREEYQMTGTFAVDTFMRLQGAGINGSILLSQFAGEKDDGE